jgi:predicted SAM-dependent methyltransferase
VKLHLGCGEHYLRGRGWTDVDVEPHAPHVVRADVTMRLPWPDGSAELVYSEHMIEHVPYRAGLEMLRGAFAVLRPGGRIRISTPDLRFLLAIYDVEAEQGCSRGLGADADALVRDYFAYQAKHHPDAMPHATPCFLLNLFVRTWGHQFIYDEETLKDAMHEAGFRAMTMHRCGESEEAELVGLENVSRLPPGYLQLETMTVEAAKP